MKKIFQLKYLFSTFLSLCIFSSCNYLDVIPPEQPDMDDMMNNASAVERFLYSCYRGVKSTQPFDNVSTDEAVNPPSFMSTAQLLAYNQLNASSDYIGCWNNAYNSIGQCHLFLKQLEQSNPLGVDETMKTEYRAEVDFLIAYLHFRVWEEYGPVPIINKWMPMDIPTSEIPGRSHFDYVVDFMCDKLDEAAGNLPAYRVSNEWGRATSTICYALKARILLYAASPLWNGGFPYKDWKNKSYETPGYGKDMVSRMEDLTKWNRALDACNFALKYAENEGQNKLFDLDALPSRATTLTDPYVPGREANDTENEAFKKRVKLMSFILHTTPDEGNKEYIWGAPGNTLSFWASLPLNIIMQNNTTASGWSCVAPTLYTVENFYTDKGKLPIYDSDFSDKQNWLKSANVPGRADITNLYVGREPRFYAWMGFDGGEYSQVLKNGQPLFLDMKSSSGNGRNPNLTNRNYSVTGFLSKKFSEPDLKFSSTSNNNKDYPLPLIRLAELYLNRAECYAAKGMTEKALSDLNTIRRRAGVDELELNDINDNMSLMDWVRGERFIELWGEPHRYYDLRRWMIAPQQMRTGAREGLNVETKVDPNFDDFNIRTRINQPFTWNNRMYILPIATDEVYSNPQMVQSPGY